MDQKNIVIIGNGISGITTARHIRKRSNYRIQVISSESDHFFSRTALMYIYMGHMKYENTKPYEDKFWEKNNIELVKKHINRIKADVKTLICSDGSEISYDTLVIASGSKSNKFGWPGQDLPGVQGLYSLQDVELMEKNTKNGIDRAIIVGGGLIGVEMAEMLLTRGYPVTFLVREDRFWGNVLPKEEGMLIAKHMIDEHHVDLRFNSELKEIIAGDNGRVQSITTKQDEKIECSFVGLTAGVSPNIDFLAESGIETKRGILVNEYLETNVPDVYALGDCAEFHQHPTGRRNIEQVWYTGRMMGETVAKSICGNKTSYAPGVWFNSAKFFDIEYQTYGQVPANPNDDEHHFYWEHSNGKISIRLVFDKNDQSLRGINVFGIRLRHKVCEEWIKEKRTVEHALEHMRDANFDPEFYKSHEIEIVQKFNKEWNSNVKPKNRSWRRILA